MKHIHSQWSQQFLMFSSQCAQRVSSNTSCSMASSITLNSTEITKSNLSPYENLMSNLQSDFTNPLQNVVELPNHKNIPNNNMNESVNIHSDSSTISSSAAAASTAAPIFPSSSKVSLNTPPSTFENSIFDEVSTDALEHIVLTNVNESYYRLISFIRLYSTTNKCSLTEYSLADGLQSHRQSLHKSTSVLPNQMNESTASVSAENKKRLALNTEIWQKVVQEILIKFPSCSLVCTPYSNELLFVSPLLLNLLNVDSIKSISDFGEYFRVFSNFFLLITFTVNSDYYKTIVLCRFAVQVFRTHHKFN